MNAYSSRLFRAIEYRSRLQRMAVSGQSHAAYLSEHPDELASRAGGLDFLERDIAAADLEGCDRESLLSEIKSYRSLLGGNRKESGDGVFDALKPTWRDAVVAALSAYVTWKGRDWLEQKAEEFARKQAAYVAEELRRG